MNATEPQPNNVSESPEPPVPAAPGPVGPGQPPPASNQTVSQSSAPQPVAGRRSAFLKAVYHWVLSRR